MGIARWWWVVAALALPLAFACSDGSDETTTVATAAVTQAPEVIATTTLAPEDDPATTVEAAVAACSDKDAARLRTLVAGGVTQEEIDALFASGTEVRLIERGHAAIEGDAAAVEVRLEVTRDGETESIEGFWDLERGADGVWRLVGLPDCF